MSDCQHHWIEGVCTLCGNFRLVKRTEQSQVDYLTKQVCELISQLAKEKDESKAWLETLRYSHEMRCEESIRSEERLKRAEAAEVREASWTETARQHLNNEQYYCGLLDRIAKVFGARAYTSDDGSVQDEVVRAKLPELVDELARNWEACEWSEIKGETPTAAEERMRSCAKEVMEILTQPRLRVGSFARKYVARVFEKYSSMDFSKEGDAVQTPATDPNTAILRFTDVVKERDEARDAARWFRIVLTNMTQGEQMMGVYERWPWLKEADDASDL